MIAVSHEFFSHKICCLSQALTGKQEALSGNPSVVNYATACSVIALLSLFYLIPATIKEGFAFHPIILISVDTFNTLLWFCAAVALAAELDVHSCNDKVRLISLFVTRTSVPCSHLNIGIYKQQQGHEWDRT